MSGDTETPKSTSVPTVAQRDDRHMRIAQWLNDYGLTPATSYGTTIESVVPHEALGILIPHEIDEREWPYCLLFPRESFARSFVGVLWMSCLEKGAVGDSWLLEIYGKKNTAHMAWLALQIAKTFDVSVTTHLVDDFPRREMIPRAIPFA